MGQFELWKRIKVDGETAKELVGRLSSREVAISLAAKTAEKCAAWVIDCETQQQVVSFEKGSDLAKRTAANQGLGDRG